MGEALQATLIQLLMLVGPLTAAGLLLWWLERSMTRMLMKRFGWRAALWTGWIGTPVHELSHALACIIFRHRITEMKLWAPDRDTGTLGYVRHAPHNPDHWYPRLGAPLIGIAPLLGGSLVLAVLTFTLVPSLKGAGDLLGNIEKKYVGMIASDSFWGAVWEFVELKVAFAKLLLDGRNFREWYFWLYLYLALCVGMHMAPSGTDIRNCWGGLVLLTLAVGVVLFVANLIVRGVTDDLTGTWKVARFVAPVMSILILSILLNSGSVLIVRVLHILTMRSRRKSS